MFAVYTFELCRRSRLSSYSRRYASLATTAANPKNRAAARTEKHDESQEALKRLAALIAGSPDHLSGPASAATTAEGGSVTLQQTLDGLTIRERRALAEALTSASKATTSPLLLVWASRALVQHLQRLAQTAEGGTQDEPEAVRLLSLPFLADLPKLLSLRAGHIATLQQVLTAVKADVALPSWPRLLALPHMEQLLVSACQADSMLASTLRQLGLSSTGDTAGSESSDTVHNRLQEVQQSALSELQRQLSAEAQQQSGDSTFLDPVAVASERVGPTPPRSGGTASGATAVPALATALHAALQRRLLVSYVESQLGLVPQDEGDTEAAAQRRTVTRLLGLGECLAVAAASGAGLTSELLEGAAQETHTMMQNMTLTWLAGQRGARVAQAPMSPSQPTLHRLAGVLRAARRGPLLAGDVRVMMGVTEAELAELTAPEFRLLRATTRRHDATGQRLLSRLLAGALDYTAVRALSVAERQSLVWAAHSGQQWTVLASRLLVLLQDHAARLEQERDVEDRIARDMITAFQTEADVARFDVLHERYIPRVNLPDLEAVAASAQLPSKDDLTTAASAAPASIPQEERLLYEALASSMHGAGSREQVAAAFEALLQGATHGSAERAAASAKAGAGPSANKQQALPGVLSAWADSVTPFLSHLDPAVLELMSRFLDLRIRSERKGAEEAQARLQAVLRAVEEALRWQLQEDASTSRRGPSPRPDRASLPVTVGALSGEGAEMSLVRRVLGEVEADAFLGWLKIFALNHHDSRNGQLQPYELLAEQHQAMDVERYLQMEHDPRLHMVLDAPPRPWREDEAPPDEAEFLEAMRPHLDSFLTASGLQPLHAIEWAAYCEAGLDEFSEWREQHEAQLRGSGASCFFNSRAEAAYLRALVTRGIPEKGPLRQQAFKYLEVLEGNASWTFAQKRHATETLVALSKHFAKHSTARVAERGSPFAPHFAPGGPPLAPTLRRGPALPEQAVQYQLPSSF